MQVMELGQKIWAIMNSPGIDKKQSRAIENEYLDFRKAENAWEQQKEDYIEKVNQAYLRINPSQGVEEKEDIEKNEVVSKGVKASIKEEESFEEEPFEVEGSD